MKHKTTQSHRAELERCYQIAMEIAAEHAGDKGDEFDEGAAYAAKKIAEKIVND